MHRKNWRGLGILLGTLVVISLVGMMGYAQVTPTITWADPADITYGTLLSSAQLNATASVPGTFAYTPASGSLLPAGNDQTLSVLFTPTDTVTYTTATADVLIDVLKADATIVVTPYDGVFDGTAHGATGTATGVLGEDLIADLTVAATTYTDVPGGAVSWSFTSGSGNYNDVAATDATVVISKADVTIVVTPYDVVFDGAAHTATATAIGALAANRIADLALPAANTNAGVYAAEAWTFTDTTGNYNDDAGTVDNNIDKADVVIVVTPYTVTYDGLAHTSTGTATGVSAANRSADLSLTGTVHTDAGDYTGDNWTFTDTTGNYNDDAGSVDNTINKAAAAITVTPYSVTYDALPHTATVVATGLGGTVDLSGQVDLSGTTHTDASPYATDPWTFAGGTNYLDDSGTVADAIAPATASITVTPYDVVYDGMAHTATVVATGVLGEDLSSDVDLSLTTHTDAGPYAADTWAFTSTISSNYNDVAPTTITDNIDKADATIVITPFVGDYDGAAHGATGTATGLAGALTTLVVDGTTYTDAPGGPVAWVFTSADPNYNDDSGDATVVINKIAATISVPDVSFVYDGDPHGATGTATGLGAAPLGAYLSVAGNSYINVSGGPVAWTFSGATNYLDDSGSADVAITKADAIIVVTPYNVVYDGLSHSAVVATGVKGEDLSADVIGAIHTDAGDYTADSWSFVDSTGNYNDNAGGTVDNNIDKADATIVVTPYDVVYDGVAHMPVATALGVLGEDLSGDLDLSSATNTNVGIYVADAWSFTSTSGNYNDVAPTTITDTITKADAVIVVTPYDVVYDGVAHTAMATALGVLGEDLSGDLDLTGTTHTDAGIYAADAWTFTDTTGNYNADAGTVDNSIDKADALISVVGFYGSFDGAMHGASGTALGVEATPANLDSLLYFGSSFRTVPGGTANWSFAGNGNYNSASGSVAIQIIGYPPTPAGMAGPGQFLDVVLPLAEGEEAPMIGTLPLAAIHEVGDIVTGACAFLNLIGSRTSAGFMHMFVSSVDLSTRPETVLLLSHWQSEYNPVSRQYEFAWDTSGLAPGYYDLRLFFGDPAPAQTFRIQLIAPSV